MHICRYTHVYYYHYIYIYTYVNNNNTNNDNNYHNERCLAGSVWVQARRKGRT